MDLIGPKAASAQCSEFGYATRSRVVVRTHVSNVRMRHIFEEGSSRIYVRGYICEWMWTCAGNVGVFACV